MPYSPLIPFLDMEEKKIITSTNVVYDCTWPFNWAPENVPVLASFKSIYPEDVQEKVLNNWESYGYKR